MRIMKSRMLMIVKNQKEYSSNVLYEECERNHDTQLKLKLSLLVSALMGSITVTDPIRSELMM